MEKLREYQDFKVVVQVVSEVEFVVSARTPEQAEDIAETLLVDGEQGNELSRHVEVLEAYPSGDAVSDATGTS